VYGLKASEITLLPSIRAYDYLSAMF